MFHVDRQTDRQTNMTKLIVALRNFANALTIRWGEWGMDSSELKKGQMTGLRENCNELLICMKCDVFLGYVGWCEYYCL